MKRIEFTDSQTVSIFKEQEAANGKKMMNICWELNPLKALYSSC